MKLSVLGQIAQDCLIKIPEFFVYARLDEFVVMPNHIHGIIIIDNLNQTDNITSKMCLPVETRLIASLPINGGFAGIKNPMLNNNLPRIIRWYKGRASFEIRKVQNKFSWQSNYHDHIIRNITSYNNILNYILNNPSRWQEDELYSL